MTDVLLIGGNHHNGLGLVRSFGRCGVKPYGLIISDLKKCFLCKSKYWKRTWVIDNYDDVPDFIMHNIKPGTVIIPFSDSAAQIIDNNLDRLDRLYCVPSIDHIQGKLSKLQDKMEQIGFAHKYNISMAQSEIIDLTSDPINLGITFPVILKPVNSVEGDKGDIAECDNQEQLDSEIIILREKGYRRILAQEFVNYDYELLLCGCMSSQPAFLIRKNIRSWPPVGGTACFGQCLNDERVTEFCRHIIEALRKEGFDGLFDIELFKKGDVILLNEINWRNTGASFFSNGTGVEYAVIWFFEKIGELEKANAMKHECKDVNQFQMNEATDLRHVVFGNLKLSIWLRDVRKCNSFALWYPQDMKPVLFQYRYLFKEMLLRLFSKSSSN